jgi:hypothetical protein
MVSKEAQLAYKFHHILVEKITKVVHIYVENKIANDLNQTTSTFLETNYNRNNFDPPYLRDVKTKIDEFKHQHGGRFPSDLDLDLDSKIQIQIQNPKNFGFRCLFVYEKQIFFCC